MRKAGDILFAFVFQIFIFNVSLLKKSVNYQSILSRTCPACGVWLVLASWPLLSSSQVPRRLLTVFQKIMSQGQNTLSAFTTINHHINQIQMNLRKWRRKNGSIVEIKSNWFDKIKYIMFFIHGNLNIFTLLHYLKEMIRMYSWQWLTQRWGGCWARDWICQAASCCRCCYSISRSQF